MFTEDVIVEQLPLVGFALLTSFLLTLFSLAVLLLSRLSRTDWRSHGTFRQRPYSMPAPSAQPLEAPTPMPRSRSDISCLPAHSLLGPGPAYK